MTTLPYSLQITPHPISLSVGTIRKPTLDDIGKLTFDAFNFYEFLLKMTPETYYTKLCEDAEARKWESMTEEERESVTLIQAIESSKNLQTLYVEALNFFFVETVEYCDGLFYVLAVDNIDQVKNEEDIVGIITPQTFDELLYVLQQVCCIAEAPEENIDDLSFKNDVARKLYEKMQKAKKEAAKKKAYDKNLTLPNIISAVATRHPSINYTNIWGLTLFQLNDVFGRMQTNVAFDISVTRVSVWGDEKKQFDPSIWYQNQYDK